MRRGTWRAIKFFLWCGVGSIAGATFGCFAAANTSPIAGIIGGAGAGFVFAVLFQD